MRLEDLNNCTKGHFRRLHAPGEDFRNANRNTLVCDGVTMMKTVFSIVLLSLLANQAKAQADITFQNGYPTPESAAALRDELLYQRATQSYLWAMPLLNIFAMKEASERKFGRGYNVLPIW